MWVQSTTKLTLSVAGTAWFISHDDGENKAIIIWWYLAGCQKFLYAQKISYFRSNKSHNFAPCKSMEQGVRNAVFFNSSSC